MLRRVAVAQIRSSSNIEENFKVLSSFTKQASDNKAKIVCFPENSFFMGRSGESLKHSQSLSGEFISNCRSLAKAHSIWLSIGSFPESSPDPLKIFNTSVMISDTGDLVSYYRKIHLFDVSITDKISFSESKYFAHGESIADIIESPIGKIGLSVCYDLRFPELYRKLVLKGAEVLFVPSAFLEKTGYAHWEVLVRARAIENSCYVVASAQEGTHDSGRISYGNSMVVDPWGNVIAKAGEDPQVIYADINLGYLQEVRRKLPSLNHIRLI